jgi:hypothetical protein
MLSLAGELKRVYVQELLPPLVMLGVLLAALYFFPWSRTAPRWLLIALTAGDLGAAAWLRPTEFAPRSPIAKDSPVLQYVTEHAAGQRVSDQHQNLAMSAGAAAQGSYRTVDIPFLWLAHMETPREQRQDWMAPINDRTDTRWEIWPGELATVQGQHPPREGDLDVEFFDPLLGRVNDGAAYTDAFPDYSCKFVVRRRDTSKVSRAWFWDAQVDTDRFEALLDPQLTRMRRPTDLTYGWLLRAPLTPVATTRYEPETKAFELEAANPGALVVADLAYPGWEARSVLPNGAVLPATVIDAGASCLVVHVARPGNQRIELTFRSRPFEVGLIVTLGAGAAWFVAVMFCTRNRFRRPRVGATVGSAP